MDWQLFENIDIVILSNEDVPDINTKIEEIIKYPKAVIITKADKGADLYYEGNIYSFPTKPVVPVDPTGAGDIFATSFTCHYYKSKDIHKSVDYANRIAGRSVASKGLLKDS